MKLTELEPNFLRREIRPCHVGAPDCHTLSEHTEHEYYLPATFAVADGIEFLCPKCSDGKGPIGVHMVICWRPRVPAGVAPGPGRWEFTGTGLDDLSLVAGSSSIQLEGGCAAHFFVTNGAIRMT
jgi:hypothetical protein